MTLNLIFDEIEKGVFSLDDEIFVSKNASSMGGSQIFLEGDKNYKVSELVKGIVIASANDACVAFAEKISGSENSFVDLMNVKAKELKMDNTCFTNCTGLPKVGQYSTAKDVSVMFCELLSHKDYFAFSKIWMDKIEHCNNRITEISNTNKLIKFYDGCDSGKTGYTSEAGFCLASSAIRNGFRVVNIIISSPDSKTRFKETSEMFNYCFDNYENKKVVDSSKNIDELLKIKNGKKENCKVLPKDDFFVISKKNEKQVFNFEFDFITVKAPIVIGDEVGLLKVYKDNILVKEIPLVSSENIDKKTFLDYVHDISSNWSLIV